MGTLGREPQPSAALCCLHTSYLPWWKAPWAGMEGISDLETDSLEKYLLWFQNMSQAVLAECFVKTVEGDQKFQICCKGHYCENSQVRVFSKVKNPLIGLPPRTVSESPSRTRHSPVQNFWMDHGFRFQFPVLCVGLLGALLS